MKPVDLHAALPLCVRASEFGFIQAVHTLCTVFFYQAAFADSTASGTDSTNDKLTLSLPFFELARHRPPPALDAFLRDNPLGPALIRYVIVAIVVVISNICRRDRERMGNRGDTHLNQYCAHVMRRRHL